MKRIATTVRCVPRYGYDSTEVRTIDLDRLEDAGEQQLHEALERWFAQRGIANAVYDIQVDDDGYFAVINDEAYAEAWGTPLI